MMLRFVSDVGYRNINAKNFIKLYHGGINLLYKRGDRDVSSYLTLFGKRLTNFVFMVDSVLLLMNIHRYKKLGYGNRGLMLMLFKSYLFMFLCEIVRKFIIWL